MHAIPIDRLHRKWRITVEAIVILNRRLMMMRVVSTILMPCRVRILERFLMVVVFVVHLQLAHGELLQTSKSRVSVRVWGGEAV
jgi:hypothetical protein